MNLALWPSKYRFDFSDPDNPTITFSLPYKILRTFVRWREQKIELDQAEVHTALKSIAMDNKHKDQAVVQKLLTW